MKLILSILWSLGYNRQRGTKIKFAWQILVQIPMSDFINIRRAVSKMKGYTETALHQEVSQQLLVQTPVLYFIEMRW